MDSILYGLQPRAGGTRAAEIRRRAVVILSKSLPRREVNCAKRLAPLSCWAVYGGQISHCFIALFFLHCNHLSPDRWTALAEATNNGSKIIMKMLLEAGADPEIRAQSDWAPLMHAAYRRDLETVNLLLEAGASFEEVSARDETVMLLAAVAGAHEVVRRLLDTGCSPNSIWSRIPET